MKAPARQLRGGTVLFQRLPFAAVWLTLLAACSDESVCPPTEPPGRPVDPDWCEPIYQTGGWWPIIAVAAVAALTVGVTWVLVLRFMDVRRRFLVLVAVTYLMVGLVSLTYMNAKIFVSLGDMVSEPLPHLLQILLWPLVVMSYLSGSFGR